jgi:sarcosine oxidase subunit beta
MQETADVIIIGAGIIGAACAFHLGESAAKVTMLEMQQAPALGQRARARRVYVCSLRRR